MPESDESCLRAFGGRSPFPEHVVAHLSEDCRNLAVGILTLDVYPKPLHKVLKPVSATVVAK